MRRSDREVTDINDIYQIMNRCEYLNLSLNDGDGYPYSIIMNFGFEVENGKPVIYLHGAKDGKKLDLIRRDDRCCFSMSRNHSLELGKAACASTWKYESVCGRGRLAFIDGDEGARALKSIMRKYDPEREHKFDERHLRAVTVMRLDIESVTGKRRDKK